MRSASALAALILAGALAGGVQAEPLRSAGITDPDTKAWWQIAEAISRK